MDTFYKLVNYFLDTVTNDKCYTYTQPSGNKYIPYKIECAKPKEEFSEDYVYRILERINCEQKSHTYSGEVITPTYTYYGDMRECLANGEGTIHLNDGKELKGNFVNGICQNNPPTNTPVSNPVNYFRILAVATIGIALLYLKNTCKRRPQPIHAGEGHPNPALRSAPTRETVARELFNTDLKSQEIIRKTRNDYIAEEGSSKTKTEEIVTLVSNALFEDFCKKNANLIATKLASRA